MTDLLSNNDSLSNSDPLKMNCPTCKKIIFWTEEYPERPFCCDRCRLIDLGEWASETHRISGEPLDINSEETGE